MKKRLIKKKKLLKAIKKHRLIITFAIIIFVFPLIVGWAYHLPLPQIIAVTSGDLLAYYGTAFGIYLSFVTYSHEKKKEEKERNRDLRPKIIVNLIKDTNQPELLLLTVNNFGKSVYRYIYLYDKYVSLALSDSLNLKISFNLSDKYAKEIGSEYNIHEIALSDGYPNYIQLDLDDVDGNNWDCCFHKVNDNGKIYYHPECFEIM